MNIFKKALIVALSIGLISVPTVTKEVEAADVSWSLAGTMNGWNASDTTYNLVFDETDNRYEITVDFAVNTEFKIVKNHSWDFSIGWSDSSKDKGKDDYLSNAGGNFKVKSAGKYLIYFEDKTSGSYKPWAGDVGIEAVSDVEVVPTPEPNNRVYVTNSSFSKSYFYAWGAYSTGDWPGVEMSKVDSDNSVFYYDYLLEESTSFNCIFNNGSGSQSANLSKTINTNSYDYKAKKWGVYYEYSITYNYNYVGAPASESVFELAHLFESKVTFKQPTRSGFNFLGWSTTSNGDVEYTDSYIFTDRTSNLELFAIWEETENLTITFDINGNKYYANNVQSGSKIEDIVPSEVSKDYGVISWDKSGSVTQDTLVTATKYFKKIDEVKAELAFSYGYISKLVVFECKTQINDGLPSVTATNSQNEEKITLDMNWCADAANEKKVWYTNIDITYDKLTFNWKNNGKEQSYSTNRDFVENAIWYDDASSNGKYSFDIEKNSTVKDNVEYAFTSVNDMTLRLGTLPMLATDFKGVSTYGIRIAKGNTIADDNYYGPTWSAENISKVDENGTANESGSYIRWNAVINNIPRDNYSDNFTVNAYVIIDGVAHDICTNNRTVSVVGLAQNYTSMDSVSILNRAACQYIVDTYSA